MVSHLQSQLACGHQNQHPRAFGSMLADEQRVQAGQHKGRRLARASLRAAQDITPHQRRRNGLHLNRRGTFKTHATRCILQWRRQIKITKLGQEIYLSTKIAPVVSPGHKSATGERRSD